MRSALRCRLLLSGLSGRIRYSLWLDGLAVGSLIRVANERDSWKAHEFVSRFKVDELVATVLPVNGEAHSVVEQSSLIPLGCGTITS